MRLAVGFLEGDSDDAECAICHLYMHNSAGKAARCCGLLYSHHLTAGAAVAAGRRRRPPCLFRRDLLCPRSLVFLLAAHGVSHLLPAVECDCCLGRRVCLHHAHHLCGCHMGARRLLYRHSLSQLQAVQEAVEARVPAEAAAELEAVEAAAAARAVAAAASVAAPVEEAAADVKQEPQEQLEGPQQAEQPAEQPAEQQQQQQQQQAELAPAGVEVKAEQGQEPATAAGGGADAMDLDGPATATQQPEQPQQAEPQPEQKPQADGEQQQAGEQQPDAGAAPAAGGEQAQGAAGQQALPHVKANVSQQEGQLCSRCRRPPGIVACPNIAASASHILLPARHSQCTPTHFAPSPAHAAPVHPRPPATCHPAASCLQAPCAPLCLLTSAPGTERSCLSGGRPCGPPASSGARMRGRRWSRAGRGRRCWRSWPRSVSSTCGEVSTAACVPFLCAYLVWFGL